MHFSTLFSGIPLVINRRICAVSLPCARILAACNLYSLRIQKSMSAKFGYLPMMTVATLGALNAESFCERVWSCVMLIVSDLHVSLKAEEIRMLVMLRMNHGFMEYMRSSYPGHSIVGIQNPSP